MSRPVFVDTWGWLALGHRRDAHHAAVEEVFRARLPVPQCVHTSDYVLDELTTLLFRRETHEEAMRFVEGVLADQVAGRTMIHRVSAERFFAAIGLRRRFQDKPMISFTDLTSMTIMAELGIREVLTEDEHFLHVGMGFQRIPERRPVHHPHPARRRQRHRRVRGRRLRADRVPHPHEQHRAPAIHQGRHHRPHERRSRPTPHRPQSHPQSGRFFSASPGEF